MDSEEEYEELGRRQQELWPDVELLDVYAEQYPDTYGGCWYDEGDFFIAFVDAEAHRGLIHDRVAHPDRIHVVTAARAMADLESAREDIERFLEKRDVRYSSGIDPTDSTIYLNLRGPVMDVAQQLQDRYGDAVDLRVGDTPFPFPDDPAELPELSPAPVPTAAWPAGLVAGLELVEPATRTGQPIRGELVLTAWAPVSFESGAPLQGMLIDHDGRVAGETGPIFGWGRTVRLEPGESTRFELYADTTSVSPARCPVLPAGEWSMVVPMEYMDPADRLNLQLVAGPFTVRLTE